MLSNDHFDAFHLSNSKKWGILDRRIQMRGRFKPFPSRQFHRVLMFSDVSGTGGLHIIDNVDDSASFLNFAREKCLVRTATKAFGIKM